MCAAARVRPFGIPRAKVEGEDSLTSPYITDSIVEGAVGLVIVNTQKASNAMTVSLFSEVAHHPTSLWVSIARKTYTHELIEQVGRFSVIILHRNQKDTALACGLKSGREFDKCAYLDLYPGPAGFLFLGDGMASTACSVRQSLPVGDHTLFIADILESRMNSRRSHLRQLLLSDL